MTSQIFHRLLIYHSDSKIYERIISKRLPGLKIQSARRKGFHFIENNLVCQLRLIFDLTLGYKKLIFYGITNHPQTPHLSLRF